jgi:hypothetical protein
MGEPEERRARFERLYDQASLQVLGYALRRAGRVTDPSPSAQPMPTWPRNTWVNARTSVDTRRSVSKPGSARRR